MSENQLVTLSKQFAVDTINLCEVIRTRGKANGVLNQLLRSGTSMGANIHEANYASSRADFINKLQIALKECYETDYWLSVFYAADLLSKEEFDAAYSNCSKLRNLLVASVKTAKRNTDK